MLIFLKILFTEFIAEMGDKTQLMLVAMASKFKIRYIIIGTALAILVLNGIAVLAGGIVSSFIPEWLIKFIAAIAFLGFALSSLSKKDEDDDEYKHSDRFKFPWLTVFCTFFIAELGDKTQLTAITFGANEGLSRAFVVWIACSVGLFAADIIGMLLGYFLKSKTPDDVLNIIAFFIFAFFGFKTLFQGLSALPDSVGTGVSVLIVAFSALIFALICFHMIFKRFGSKIRRSASETNQSNE